MNEPYFNTILKAKVAIQPNQMDNNIRHHLKKNISDKYKDKNYKDYGCIIQIISLVSFSAGELIAEDTRASAIFTVHFRCKLCRPLKNTFITCTVSSINMSMINLVNGPITLMCFLKHLDTINKNKFIIDNKQTFITGINENGERIKVLEGTNIKVKVNSMRIEDGQKNILVYGYLEQLSTKEEIINSIKARESLEEIYVDYDKHVNPIDNDISSISDDDVEQKEILEDDDNTEDIGIESGSDNNID
jgi:DNA-directed RNA polymerase subunit E'/Rpb7